MLIDTEKLFEAVRLADAREGERIDKIKDDRKAIIMFTKAEAKYTKLYQLIDEIEALADDFL